MDDQIVSIGPLEVLRSAAGYYIGRMCIVHEQYGTEWIECPEPYSRESDYFKTYEAAKKALRDGFEVRDAIENQQLNMLIEIDEIPEEEN